MRPATTSSRSTPTVEKLCVGQLTTRVGMASTKKLNEMQCCRPPSYCGAFAAESIRKAGTGPPVAGLLLGTVAGCGDVARDPFRPTRRPRRHRTTGLLCGGAAPGLSRTGEWGHQSLVAPTLSDTIHGGGGIEHFRCDPLFQRGTNPILRMWRQHGPQRRPRPILSMTALPSVPDRGGRSVPRRRPTNEF